MKLKLLLIFQACCLLARAQKGDELLVYSLTGNITVIENNKESKLKIGKVLKPEAVIKTQKLAKLTMVCKQGKPISVTKEGSYPVSRWKDSCKTTDNSVTTKYFQYIWDQLYVRSDDYRNSNANTETTGAPIRGQEELEILPLPGLDTLHYAGGPFRLSWISNQPYDGKYNFTLYSLKSKKSLMRDSVLGSIDLERLRKFMKPGNKYYWTVSAEKSTETEGGIIIYQTKMQTTQYISKLKKMITVPEDAAAQNLRIAYLLEESGYAADALLYYQKAAALSAGTDFYREMLIDFRKKFNINAEQKN